MPENNEIRTPREGAGTAPEETNAGAAAAWPDISGVPTTPVAPPGGEPVWPDNDLAGVPTTPVAPPDGEPVWPGNDLAGVPTLSLIHIFKSCTMVTRLATITMKAGIRTRSGMIFLKREMIRLENISTAVVERPIPSPLMADVVVARVGHIPNIRMKVGFSLIIPLYRRSVHLFMNPHLLVHAVMQVK